MREYALIATVDGNFAFSDFSIYRDAMFASLRIMEMLSCSHLKLSEISKMIAHFYYKQSKIACTQSLKGKNDAQVFRGCKRQTLLF